MLRQNEYQREGPAYNMEIFPSFITSSINMYDALIDSQSTSVKSFCQDQRDSSTLMKMERYGTKSS